MFKLPELTYPYESLAPTVSGTTTRTHHDKHHAAYVNTTNALVKEKGLPSSTMEEVVRLAAQTGEQKLFNQSGQAWNHAFFWECMTPNKTAPSGALAQAIETAGGLDGLKAKFVAEGVGHFASGWVWLVARSGVLEVISTHDADTAITREGVTPILVCDLWEHAYYLDYKNLRKDFLEAWFDNVANWSFAEAQFAAATGGGQGYRYPAPVSDAG